LFVVGVGRQNVVEWLCNKNGGDLTLFEIKNGGEMRKYETSLKLIILKRLKYVFS
jgi:hypothetical protein